MVFFSIEDDLDYKIATDNYLYQIYLVQLSNLMTELSDGTLSMIVSDVFNEIRPFYDNNDVLKQSIYDRKETSKTKLFENVGKIESFLTKRRNRILEDL